MYSQSITRTHRTAFVVLVDGSGSMGEEILFRGIRISKAKAVSMIANELLFELIERARRTEGIRDYYDVALYGYSGDNEVRSLLDGGDEMISIDELARRPHGMTRQTLELRLPDGSAALREMQTPEWIAPHAAGNTPMIEALRTARDLVARWIAREENYQSFPPIVFNITDGEASDCDREALLDIASQIRSLRTAEGEVLLVNIHISSNTLVPSCTFPASSEELAGNRYATLLYEASSPMPSHFEPLICEMKQHWAKGPFRGMSYNTSIHELALMLNIGSISIPIH